jgi:(p)ppGpp synthase/HD superfamily hydrolase
MNDLTRIMQAADMAARWHVGQRRKGQAAEPYINHLLEVACLVTTATEGGEPDVVIAALLHDSVEDQGITIEAIAGAYGRKVADIVTEVTDDKSLPKAERKRLQVETAGRKSREARLIKLADKTSNLRAIANSPPPDWPLERRLEYVRWAREVVAQLQETSPWLEQQFNEAADHAEQSATKS